MTRGSALYLCGGDLRPGPRAESCPNVIHDWPLPSGYIDASEVAASRLRRGWANVACPDCARYGWRPGSKIDPASDVRVPSNTREERP